MIKGFSFFSLSVKDLWTHSHGPRRFEPREKILFNSLIKARPLSMGMTIYSSLRKIPCFKTPWHQLPRNSSPHGYETAHGAGIGPSKNTLSLYTLTPEASLTKRLEHMDKKLDATMLRCGRAGSPPFQFSVGKRNISGGFFGRIPFYAWYHLQAEFEWWT